MLFLFLSTLLLSVLFKDDTQSLVDSEFFSDLAQSPLILQIKQISPSILVCSFLLGGYILFVGVYALAKNNSNFIYKNTLSLTLVMLSFFSVVRGYCQDPSVGFQFLQAFLVLLFIYLVLSISFVKYGVDNCFVEIKKALYFISIIFVMVNAIGFYSGYGFVADNPRFFGSSSHPNFIGVQLSLCAIILISHVKTDKNLFYLLPVIVFCLVLLVMSGSRTSILMLVAGMVALNENYISSNRKKFFSTLLFVFILVGVVIYFAPQSVFDRGDSGGDTRSEVWFEMIVNISNNFWFGLGSFVGASENSYLRAMVAFGFLYGLILFLTCISTIFSLYFNSKSECLSLSNKPEKLFFTLMFSLFIGSLFEGFLSDLWSFPKIVFFVISLTCLKRSVDKNNTL